MNPRIYVGTYAKYNNGSIKGDWLDPADYEDRDAFYAACRELHSDETDPELMFQDWEDIPQCLIKESYICDSLWDWVYMDEPDLTTVAVYWDGVDSSASAEYALDRLVSTVDAKYETKSAAKRKWFWEFSEETGFFDGWPATARNYFDEAQWIVDAGLDSFDFVVSGDTLYVFHK